LKDFGGMADLMGIAPASPIPDEIICVTRNKIAGDSHKNQLEIKLSSRLILFGGMRTGAPLSLRVLDSNKRALWNVAVSVTLARLDCQFSGP
jgi:hypothetical protein